MSVRTLRERDPSGSREISTPTVEVLSRVRGDTGWTTRWAPLCAVLVLMLASLWLRTGELHFHYWIDEGISVGIASHPLSQLPALLRQDGSPPLFYFLLHVWMQLFGRNEAATHVLSLLFALLTIPVAYWAGSSVFDRRAGLVSAVLAASVPFLTTYGQETRMYSLLALLSLLVSASFVHAFVLGHRRYIPVFALSLTAALYTHNWALFLALACSVAYLVCVYVAPRERRLQWRDGALAFGAVALMYAPWLPTLLYQAKHTGAPWALAPVLWSLTQGLYAIVGGRGAAVALLLAGGSGLMALRGKGDGQSRVRLAVDCLLLLGVGTLLIAWLYSKVTPAWAVRYLAVVVGPLIVLFGLGLARAGRLGLIALVLVVCFWVLDPVSHSLDTKSNVASVAARFRAQLGPGSLVLSTQPEQVPVMAYYLPEVSRYGTPLGPVPDPRVVDWRNALNRLRHSSVGSTLLPMVRALAPGERLLLIVPLREAKQPLWLKLIRRDSLRWTNALVHDRQLKLIARASPDASVAGVAVQGTLFERRSS